MLNSVNLVGILAKDIDIKNGKNGSKYAYVDLAVKSRRKNEDNKYKYEYITLRLDTKNVEFVSRHWSKGAGLSIEGHLVTKTNKYKERSFKQTIVVVDNADFIPSNSYKKTTESERSKADNNEQSPEDFDDPFAQPLDDNQLPF